MKDNKTKIVIIKKYLTFHNYNIIITGQINQKKYELTKTFQTNELQFHYKNFIV